MPVAGGIVAVVGPIGVETGGIWASAETMNSTKNSDEALPYLMIGVIFDIVKLTFL